MFGENNVGRKHGPVPFRDACSRLLPQIQRPEQTLPNPKFFTRFVPSFTDCVELPRCG